MNYSKRHKWVASVFNHFPNINERDVLNYPQNYLGPNYKSVLNYWFYLESLSYIQERMYPDRFLSFNPETWNEVFLTSKELTKEVIDPRFVDYLYPIELELIASHLYIERGIPFTFLPLIIDL
jgi:hypothetical protein